MAVRAVAIARDAYEYRDRSCCLNSFHVNCVSPVIREIKIATPSLLSEKNALVNAF